MDMNVSLSSLYPSSSSKTTNDSQEHFLEPGQLSQKAEQGLEPVSKDLGQVVQSLQEFVQSIQRNLDFSIDDSTGVLVVKVIAKDTGELIRQLPSEEALQLAKNLKELDSVLLNAKA